MDIKKRLFSQRDAHITKIWPPFVQPLIVVRQANMASRSLHRQMVTPDDRQKPIRRLSVFVLTETRIRNRFLRWGQLNSIISVAINAMFASHAIGDFVTAKISWHSISARRKVSEKELLQSFEAMENYAVDKGSCFESEGGSKLANPAICICL